MIHHRFLLITYPGQGHLNPALEFAKRLIAMGAAHVTLGITVHMYRRMTKKVNIPGLSLVPFSDGYDDGFNAIAGADADYKLYTSELKRRDSEFVTNLIVSSAQEGHPFTCLTYTLIVPWAQEVARGFNLPTALLWIEPATVLGILYYYFHGYGDYINEKFTKEPLCSSIALPGFPFLLSPRDIPSFLLVSNPSVLSFVFPLFEEQIKVLDMENNPIVLVNSFEALEPEAFRAVDKLNMIPIGPLIPSAYLDGKDSTDTSFGGDFFQDSNDYIQWLDSKPGLSVVYVSFGSYFVLSKRQMEEIARALLDCGCPFLWVIREKEEEELGCREELEEKGKIVKWCSQLEVLSHPSLGCFVTHCGWNSTMESLVSGVPVVAFPQWSDQKTNAKMIEDVWKTGMRVDHEVNGDVVVQAEEIRTCLEVVMGSGEKGNELRNNAKKWKSLAKEAAKEGGPSEKNLRTFLDYVAEGFRVANNS
ncbi:phloretin 4'-O-glucosyltransferase-like [Gastrolobium bilobum]|uniref:phloretin 4'-O-glucosyltransferase-like n=1 Tax=Gastrolobium bilobum TaxID=150636 RepID=UPI002AB111EA|nr:phloretin 4'-O-glucosyltransferase-like [Gastrolobium bilobum]